MPIGAGGVSGPNCQASPPSPSGTTRGALARNLRGMYCFHRCGGSRMCESAEIRRYARAIGCCPPARAIQTNVRSFQGVVLQGGHARARPLHGEGLGLARRRRAVPPLARAEAHGGGHPRAGLPVGAALPARAARRAGLAGLPPHLRPRVARGPRALPAEPRSRALLARARAARRRAPRRALLRDGGPSPGGGHAFLISPSPCWRSSLASSWLSRNVTYSRGSPCSRAPSISRPK